jgi:hypothetical protein
MHWWELGGSLGGALGEALEGALMGALAGGLGGSPARWGARWKPRWAAGWGDGWGVAGTIVVGSTMAGAFVLGGPYDRREREKRKERAVCECAEGPVVTTVKWYSPTVALALTHLKPQLFTFRRNAAQIKRNSTHQQFANYHGLVDTTSQIL